MMFPEKMRTSDIDTLLKHYSIFTTHLSEAFIVPKNITITHIMLIAGNIFIFYIIFGWLSSAYIMEYHRILQNYVETSNTRKVSYSTKACKPHPYIRVQAVLMQLEAMVQSVEVLARERAKRLLIFQ